jgi:hypothetical protein
MRKRRRKVALSAPVCHLNGLRLAPRQIRETIFGFIEPAPLRE